MGSGNDLTVEARGGRNDGGGDGGRDGRRALGETLPNGRRPSRQGDGRSHRRDALCGRRQSYHPRYRSVYGITVSSRGRSWLACVLVGFPLSPVCPRLPDVVGPAGRAGRPVRKRYPVSCILYPVSGISCTVLSTEIWIETSSRVRGSYAGFSACGSFGSTE
jgi:hypothetical protein